MERELWNELYATVSRLGKVYRSPGVQHADAWIVLVFLWAVLHDRPRCWACQESNWPLADRPVQLPSPSTLSRRLRTDGVRELLNAAERDLRERQPHSCVKVLDSLPLPIGASSQDPDAGYGWAGGCKARGYKLHVVLDKHRGIEAWDIEPMNRNEKAVAPQLLYQLDSQAYLPADSQYDSNHLYEIAHDVGSQLVSVPKKGKGLGHRRQSPYRLRSRELLDKPLGRALLAERGQIERFFGQLGNFAGGLSPLPHWVRRRERVWVWVQGKLILNAIRLALKARLTG